MTKITHISIIFLTLMALVSSITKKVEEEPKTIVEANRFYSTKDKKAFYNITGVTPKKPLILLLKASTNLQQLVKEGLTLIFTGGDQHVVCPFDAITDLCVVPSTPDNLTLLIDCKALPCEVEWVIYQLQPRNVASNMPALNLYSLQNTTHHLIGQITCNDPKIQTLAEDVVVYSQTPYSRAYFNNVVYIFFNSFQYGNVYIDVAEASRACAFVNFTNVAQEIRPNQNAIKDFAQKGADTTFVIKNVPTTDFAVECSAIRLDSYSALKSVIKLYLLGWKGQKSTIIVNHQIKAIARSEANDFTFVFKAPPAGFDQLTLEFMVDNAQLYLIDFNVITGSFFMVDLGTTTYFSLKKGEKITLKLEGDQEINDIEKYYLIEKRKAEINLNTHECDPKIGCNIQIEALADTDNLLYLSSKNEESTHLDENGKGLFEFQQIQFITINKKAKRKIRMGDNLFFRKQIKKGNTYKVHVNSPNVLIYAASKSKCQAPSTRCRQRTSNYRHPFVYGALEDDQLHINVEGLQNTEFELTVVEDNKLIELTDGTPFSYSMDEEEQRIDFSFKLSSKADITFNLVAPLNALKLYVSNTLAAENNLQNLEQSTDGFIEFKKGDIDGLDFTVSVVKTSKDKYYSHFVLIASTKNAKQRLQSSVTNYETLPANHHKDFIFEFDKKEQYILGISVFNLKTKSVDLQIRVSQSEEWSEADPIKVAKQVDFIDIQDVSRSLCLKGGDLSCQLFVRVYNKMSIEVDFTFTLYARNSVMELKDGIWQSFPVDLVMATSNFYFYPRHNRSDLLLLFHSPLTRTKVSSKLFRYDSEHINPAEWPFPFLMDPHDQDALPYRTNHYISISKEELNSQCWPNCVLLVNFYIQQADLLPMSSYQYSYFKLMVSNNQVELPQNQKVSFALGKNEDRQVLIDLKYILEKQYMIFYTTSTIGDCSISANVYSEKHQVCPIVNEDPDFTINWGEQTLYIDDIKASLKDKGMENDKNVYLCASVHSENSCKFSLQYSTQNDGFKEITVDSYEDIKLAANETKYFKISGKMESYSKITRLSGFPFISFKKCEQTESIQQCKDNFKDSNDKGRQIVAKTQSFREEGCDNCQILFKFHAQEAVVISFHSQSKASELELKEKITLSDFLNEYETNKYQVHARNGEDLNVNIHVQEGDIEVHLSDSRNVNLMKKSSNEQRVIQFNVKDNKDQHVEKQHSEGMKAGLGNFIVYHLSVASVDEKKAASYTIGYSSGNSQFFLQDGLIVDYQLNPKTPHSFFYCNERTKQPVIYTLATESAQSLKELKIKAFTFQEIGQDEAKKQIQLGKPATGKKAPGPTIVYNLPTSVCFEIQLINPTSKAIKASMGINHQQVLFLPFNHEYPFQLHKNEYLSILADVNIPGFIELHIKKCDQSNPTFSYTFDYDSFIKGEYMYKGVLDDLTTTISIKAQRIGTLFLIFQSGDEDSLLSTNLVYSEEKKKVHINSPGRHGQLEYMFLDNGKLNITLGAVQCGSCKVKKYSAVSSESQEDLYQHMMCPNTYFGTQEKTPIKAESISFGKNDKQLHFMFDITLGVQYVGVIAELDTGEEIYYRPIEIATLWGRLNQKTSSSYKLWLALIGTISVFCCLICCRRISRQGYRPLNEAPEI